MLARMALERDEKESDMNLTEERMDVSTSSYMAEVGDDSRCGSDTTTYFH